MGAPRKRMAQFEPCGSLAQPRRHRSTEVAERIAPLAWNTTGAAIRVRSVRESSRIALRSYYPTYAIECNPLTNDLAGELASGEVATGLTSRGGRAWLAGLVA